MSNFWEIISGAPWWVYVLFVGLVNIGVKAIKPRTLTIKRVVLIPTTFLAWSIFDLYQKSLSGFSSLILIWIVALVLGSYLGMKSVSSWKITTNHQKHEITIPGNYSTLVLILSIFILKFFWGYFYDTHPKPPYWIYFVDILTCTLLTGCFVGRSIFFFWNYHKQE